MPAVILIEDPQTELFVEGESLGRWSLADVRAERLIASAFSLDLDGDEVTFIADDPINFAYGGVDEMAKVWARYKTMTMPRRMVATSRSRKGTKPSRIGDLRSAIEETLSGPSSKPAASPPAQSERPFVAADPIPDPVARPVEPEAVVSDAVETEATVELEAIEIVESEILQPPVNESETPIGRVDEEPTDGMSGEEMVEPVPDQIPTRASNQESVFKDVVPWAGQAVGEHVGSEAGEVEPEPVEPEPAPTVGSLPIAASANLADTAADEPILDSGPARDVREEALPDDDDLSVPWLEPAAAGPSETPQPIAPPVVVERDPPPAPEPPQYVVDLGAFEQAERAVARVEPTPPEDPDEMALEPAMAATSERGGIMGAVRSAFVRNRDVHDHDYAAAPGGIGIVRNICTHCGHISIGVAE
ncbi:MAG TPA: hypothetical protein VIW94_10345 [Acidimicrobiia bacterium]